MRLALAIVILAASAACAHAAEDRYGPVSSAPAAAAAAPYAGPMLSWAGKSVATVPQGPQIAGPVRPAMTPGGLYRPAPAPSPSAPVSVAPARYSPPAPAPQSLYSQPAPATPVAVLAPPPSPVAVQGGLYAGSGPRFYSVHRAYGETPDPIPTPPQGERMAYRPEASLAGAVALTGVGDGVRQSEDDDGGMAGVGAADEAEEAERAAKRDAERAAARRAAAGGSQ